MILYYKLQDVVMCYVFYFFKEVENALFKEISVDKIVS